ncbi:MAG: phosphocholine cytidylyltransferase family protein [Myxococcota bacterium]
MHAIILAAGRGSRLGGLTDTTPKCMMTVGGRTLLERQIEAYRTYGVEVAAVRGYLADRITPPGVRTFDNPEWETTGLLTSLFCAEPAMENGFFISYGDTTFRPEFVGLILDALKAGHPMAGIVDTAWERVYEGRDWHPPEQAENVLVDDNGHMTAVGKRVPGSGSLGEFIGLLGVSAEAAQAWRREYHALLDRVGQDGAWGQLGTVRRAYSADLLQHLIDQGHSAYAVTVEGGWREIDTPEDLELAQAAVTW